MDPTFTRSCHIKESQKCLKSSTSRDGACSFQYDVKHMCFSCLFGLNQSGSHRETKAFKGRRVPRRWSACKIIRLQTDSVQLSPWPFQGRTLQVFLPESAFVLFAQKTQRTQCDQMLILVAPVNPCGSCQDIPFRRTATKQFRSCTHGTRIAWQLIESKRRHLISNHEIMGNYLILMASAA